MPEYKTEYIVELLKKGDFSAARKEFDQLDNAAKKSGASMAAFGTNAKAAFAALGGIALLKASLDAFIESEHAVAKLNVALKNTGQFTKEYSEQLQKMAKDLSEVTAFTDEAILNVTSKLLSLGAPRQEIGKLTEMVLDLATLLDKDLNRATLAIGQTFRGEFGMLEQIGVNFDNASTGAQKFQTAMEQVAKISGGQAREAMKGLSGTVDQTKKDFEEAKEAIGKMVAEVVAFLYVESKAEEAKFRATYGLNPPPGATTPPPPKSTGAGMPSRGSLMKRGQVTGSAPNGDTTPAAIKKADLEAYMAAVWQIDAEEDEAEKKRAEQAAKDLAEQTKNEMATHQDRMDAANMERQLDAEIAQQGLEGIALEMERARAAHEERIAQIQQLKFEDVDQYTTLIEKENELFALQQKRIADAHSANAQLKRDLLQVGALAKDNIAGGLANAFVSAARGARVEWDKFFADFAAQIAEAILKALILRAISGIVGSIGGVEGPSGQTYTSATGNAGTYYRPQSGAFESNLMAMQSSRFTMSAPRQLARSASSAAAPARGGGMLDVRLTLSPELRAEIISDSVEGARVQVAEDMGRNTPIASATKRLVS